MGNKLRHLTFCISKLKLSVILYESRNEQFRAAPEHWMERSGENQFGSVFVVKDSDDEGIDDYTDVAGEIHAIQSYGCEWVVNHFGLTCTSDLGTHRHGLQECRMRCDV